MAECLAKSNSEETQDCARNLLQQLSNVSGITINTCTQICRFQGTCRLLDRCNFV